jgi:hypothetical protein
MRLAAAAAWRGRRGRSKGERHEGEQGRDRQRPAESRLARRETDHRRPGDHPVGVIRKGPGPLRITRRDSVVALAGVVLALVALIALVALATIEQVAAAALALIVIGLVVARRAGILGRDRVQGQGDHPAGR